MKQVLKLLAQFIIVLVRSLIYFLYNLKSTMATIRRTRYINGQCFQVDNNGQVLSSAPYSPYVFNTSQQTTNYQLSNNQQFYSPILNKNTPVHNTYTPQPHKKAQDAKIYTYPTSKQTTQTPFAIHTTAFSNTGTLQLGQGYSRNTNNYSVSQPTDPKSYPEKQMQFGQRITIVSKPAEAWNANSLQGNNSYNTQHTRRTSSPLDLTSNYTTNTKNYPEIHTSINPQPTQSQKDLPSISGLLSSSQTANSVHQGYKGGVTEKIKQEENKKYQFYNNQNKNVIPIQSKETKKVQKQWQTNDWKKTYLEPKASNQFNKNHQYKQAIYNNKNVETPKVEKSEWERKLEKTNQQCQDNKRKNASNNLPNLNTQFQRIYQKQNQIRGLQSQKKTLAEQVAAFRIKQKQHDRHTKQLDSKIANLNSEIEQLNHENTTLKQNEKAHHKFKQNVSTCIDKNKYLQSQLNTEIALNKITNLQLAKLKNQLQRERQASKNQTLKLKDSLNFKQNFYRTLQQQCNQLKSQAATSQQKLRDLEQRSNSKIVEHQNEKIALHNKNIALQAEVNKLQSDLNMFKQDYNKLLNNINPNDQQSMQTGQTQKLNQKLNYQIQQKASNSSLQQAQINRLLAQLNSLKGQSNNQSKQNQSESLNGPNYHQLLQENQMLRKDLQMNIRIYIGNENNFKDIIGQLQKLNKENAKQKQTLKLQLKTKDQILLKLQADVSRFSKNQHKFLRDIQKLHTALAIQKSQAQSQAVTRAPSPNNQSQIMSLGKEIGELKQRLSLKQEQIKKLAQQLDRTKDERFAQNGFLRVELMNKQTAIKDLSRNVQEISKSLQEAQFNYQTLQKQPNHFEKLYKDQSSNLKRITEELQLLKKDKAVESSSLRNQLKIREDVIDNLKKANLGAANDRYNLILEENRKLQKKIQQKEQGAKEVQEIFMKVQRDYEELRKQYASLEKRQVQLQNFNDELTDKVSVLSRERNKYLFDQNAKETESNSKLSLQNASLRQTIKQLQRNLSNQKQRLKSQSIKIQSLSNELAHFKIKNQQAEKRYRQINNQLAYAQQQKNKMQAELKQSNAKYTALYNQRNQFAQRTGLVNQQINQLKHTNQRIIDDLQKLNQNKNELQKRNQDLKDKNDTLSRQISKLADNNTSNDIQINRLSIDNSGLRRQVANFKIKVASYENQVRQKSANDYHELVACRSKNAELQAKLREIYFIKQRTEQQLNQLQSQVIQLKKIIRDQENDLRVLDDKKRQTSILATQKEHLQHELYRFKNQYSELQQAHLELTKKFQNKQSLSVKDDGCNHLFHGDVLRDEEEYKIYIKQCIENHMKIKIHDTRLIYRFDTLNKQNIHKYIDQKPQLVVVIKLINGFFLAGYTQGFFKPRTPSEKQGLVMSLSNKKCYYLMQRNRRAISYDDFFVIFGNSEIRIKSQEKKIFSNFGVSNSYYRHNGDGVNMLLGGTKTEREMEIVGYEFFQLILKR